MNPRELDRIGRYRVRRFIAEGGMAWVFEVEDPTFEGRRLALKMLKPEAAEGDQFRRFESEARLLAGIDHPNLITIFDLGNDAETGCYYYTMNMVEGPALSDKGVLSVDEAVPIFIEVLAGLAKLHERGIVHRDIKPANILTHTDGRAVVADLGIARVESMSSDLTKTMMAIGTVKYMSPEQARGHKVGAASDVLSVGLTFYQVVTGESVYDSVDSIDSGSGQSILFYLGAMSGRSGSELPMVFSSDFPSAIRKVILKSCRFKAEDRYQNAGEMRQALIAAHQQPASPVGLRMSTGLIGGALAAIAAVAGIVWYGSTQIAATNADDALARLDQVQAGASAIVEQTASLSPPIPNELSEEVEKRMSHAEIFGLQGREKLETGNASSALVLIEDAIDYYQKVCSEILTKDLNSRAEASANNAKSRVNEISTHESRQLLPDAFAGLNAMLAGLEPPAADLAPCEAGQQQLARLEVSGKLSTEAGLVERNLKDEWPRLANRAKEAADQAERSAQELSVEAIAYTGPLAEGRESKADGEAALAAEDFLGARRAFVAARESFEMAAQLAPAARAREEALALHLDSSADLKSQSVVTGALKSAEALYSAERWAEATGEFKALTTLIQGLAADRKAASAALAAADAAAKQRAEALSDGAEFSAGDELAAAERARSGAVAELEAKRYDSAESGFARAQSHYQSAKAKASARLAEALESAAKTRKQGAELIESGQCESLGGPARTPCIEGTESERLGLAALAERNTPDAMHSFEHARGRYQVAGSAERAFLANRPQPPFLVKREPSDKVVRQFRNTPVNLKIEAADPNQSDVLRYSWNVDGKTAGGDSPAFTYRGDRDAEVTVTVDDGHQGLIEQTWQLSFDNRQPNLSLSPSSRSVALSVGEKYEFEANATDPDGESVRYAFAVNGEQVSTKPRYTFVAERAGSFEVTARAIDGGGASVRKSVQIKVAAKAPPPQVAVAKPKTAPPPPAVTKPRAPEPIATPEPAPVVVAKIPTPAPSPPTAAKADPNSSGVAALREYESAYESLDVGRLSRVWIMNRNQKKAMTTMFKDVKSLTLDLTILGVTVEDESVHIDFDQKITSQGRARISSKPARMTATVIPQAGGRWIISSILPRG